MSNLDKENTVIVLAPVTARLIESYRDAESFNDPIANRSEEWHALKFIQFPLWAVWGYTVLKSEQPLTHKGLTVAFSLGLSWFAFEMSLNGFRN